VVAPVSSEERATRKRAGRVKGDVRRGDKRRACKGGSTMRRQAGVPYEARTYCYTLEKREKPFVGNGKGVIGVIEHP
jgi:hypothetical protein